MLIYSQLRNRRIDGKAAISIPFSVLGANYLRREANLGKSKVQWLVRNTHSGVHYARARFNGKGKTLETDSLRTEQAWEMATLGDEMRHLP
jgi:hypothetical protein